MPQDKQKIWFDIGMNSHIKYSVKMIDMKDGRGLTTFSRQFLKRGAFLRASRWPKGSWTLQILRASETDTEVH